MHKPEQQLFVCASFRTDGELKGICHKQSVPLLPYLENEVVDRGLDAQVTSTGCMKACEHGPVMIVYPEGTWYGGVSSEVAIDAILDALEEKEIATDYLIN